MHGISSFTPGNNQVSFFQIGCPDIPVDKANNLSPGSKVTETEAQLESTRAPLRGLAHGSRRLYH